MLLLPSAKAQPLAAVHMGGPPDQAHAASGDHGEIGNMEDMDGDN